MTTFKGFGGGPAFPHAELRGPTFDDEGGMSLRDYFAAANLPALGTAQSSPKSYEEAAEWCYRMADAMLAERAK